MIKRYLGKSDTIAPIKPIFDDDVYNTTLDPSETIKFFNLKPRVEKKKL